MPKVEPYIGKDGEVREIVAGDLKMARRGRPAKRSDQIIDELSVKYADAMKRLVDR